MTPHLIEKSFNPAPSTVMHIDLNSCFASVEQQANPFLRDKPLSVAAYDTPNGCILSSSIQAKRLGVKTGMRVKEAKILCPDLVVLQPDPNKYRFVHVKLRDLLSKYTPKLYAKSIDEFVLETDGNLRDKAGDIKNAIKTEIGDYLTVSIGISTNKYLAKVGSDIQKPNGLVEINKDTFSDIYKSLIVSDLCGIANRTRLRLNKFNIFSAADLYNSSAKTLQQAFHAVTGYCWYMRLRGWEIEDYEPTRRSFSNSYSLPKPFSSLAELTPILSKLVEKMSIRFRLAGYKARGVYLGFYYTDKTFWHKYKN